MAEPKKRKRASVKDVLTLLKDFPEMAKAILSMKSLQGRIWEKLEAIDAVLVTLAEKPAQRKISEYQEKDLIPEAYKDLVHFYVDDNGHVIVKTKGWLGEKWQALNDHLKDLGFTWVSAGKDSHWKKGGA